MRRKIRIMENDKKAYAEESEKLFERQAKMIEKLKDENKTLCKDMLRSNKAHREATKPANIDADIRIIKEKLNKETQIQKQLDDEMKSVQKQIVERKRVNQSTNVSQSQVQANQAQQIKVLENRLENATMKFNESISKNKELRSQIDAYRKEKVIFESVYYKLEKQLQDKRSEMNELIDVANNVYEEKDKVQSQLANLKLTSEKEQNEFNAEISAVQELIEKDDHMRNQITSNLKKNHQENSEVNKITQKLKGTPHSSHRSEDETINQLKELTKQKISNYEEAFIKIMAATGISDLDRLVA